MNASEVVVLCGGTGGAKLARGLAGVLGPERLTALVNTGDDIEIYGAYVSPDPDLVSFWLADLIDERGWGLRDDSFAVMDGLRELGVEVWFNLGDRDLAWCLRRAQMLAGGSSATEALARLNDAIGLRARVLPMSDEPVRTWVSTRERGWSAFQEFMIASRAQGELDGLELRGVQDARPTAQVLESLARARAIIIGPSNPVISIGPILAVPGMRAAIADSPAPVIAVSPIVGGQVVKGPTAAFMRFAGRQCSAAGVAELYDGLLDGMVADEAIEGLPSLRIATLMDDAEGRRRVAEETLSFADSLSR